MKSLRAVIAFVILSILAGSAAVTLDTPGTKMDPAPAGNPARPAVEALNRGLLAKAARLAKPLAEKGNPEALLIMGLAYQGGWGMDPSVALAVEHLRKSRQAGNREAPYRLARLLVDQGSEEGRKEAREILEGLTNGDHGVASRLLGEGSLWGWFGGEPDFERTRFWWTKAADQGDLIAVLALARLLDGSFGFPDKRDPAAALEQFLQAAELGSPAGMVAVGSRLLNWDEEFRNEKDGREWLAKALAKEQFDAYLALGDFEELIKKDDQAAFLQYRKGAEAGQSGCMLKLAVFFNEGRGGQPKDAENALKWFKEAGKAGNPLGDMQAAAILLNGEGLQMVEGYSHLLTAAEAGLAGAQNELGLLYLSGRLGGRDATAAAGWFSRSAAGGFPQAVHNLGALYERGVGVPRNLPEAGRLYNQAANAGHPQATTALGRFIAQGLGTEPDPSKAWALFSLAVERGDQDARIPLSELHSKLTDAQLKEGRRLLVEFRKNPGKPESAGETSEDD